jgi:uncharacterized protein (DUF433 family)
VKLENYHDLVKDPEVMGGTLVFKGTRIPVEAVFVNLIEGMTLEEVADAFPPLTLNRLYGLVEWMGKKL